MALLLAALLLAACGTRAPEMPLAAVTSHPGEAWWPHRAVELGIAEDEVRARDEALPTDRPPEHVAGDLQLALEAAALWRDRCARCHGLGGDPADAPEPPADPERPPRDWTGMGPAMGFLFGGDAMRAGIYRSIAEGVPPPAGEPWLMRGFAGELSREQIWALVHHLERF